MSSIGLTKSSNSNLNSNSSVDEHKWVIQIRRILDDELEEDSEIPVSIFNVPKILMATDPDSYVPQQVALGPYHHWRPELYEMERYKLAAEKRTQKQLQNLKYQHLVEHMTNLEPGIRACYHKYLNFNGETLAWMMAIDSSFLLEFLQIYNFKEGMKSLTRVSSRMTHLVDVFGRKSAHNAILRDIVMLENQIPMFLLRKMLEFQFSSIELADTMLVSMLIGLCKELCPFKMIEEFQNVELKKSAHLLDFLYQVILPKLEDQHEETHEIEVQDEANQSEEKSFGKSSYVKALLQDIWKLISSHVKALLQQIWKLISKLNKGPVLLIKKVLFSKPIKVILKFPWTIISYLPKLKFLWTIISNLPGIKILKQPVEYLFFNQEKKQKLENDSSNLNNNINKPPLIEEITIPSVTELSEAGFHFSPIKGRISAINFDLKTVTIYLPTISLDVNSEVILRNLVAYESCNASGPLVFTRYTELMNGIIDTEEDAKILREKGIILNRLKSDLEVADLWNGMSKSVRLTKVPFLDKVIEDVNKYYNGKWKVKVGKLMKIYVFGSWQFLTFLAAILLLLLTTLQAFCSVYSCSRLFRITTIQ